MVSLLTNVLVDWALDRLTFKAVRANWRGLSWMVLAYRESDCTHTAGYRVALHEVLMKLFEATAVPAMYRISGIKGIIILAIWWMREEVIEFVNISIGCIYRSMDGICFGFGPTWLCIYSGVRRVSWGCIGFGILAIMIVVVVVVEEREINASIKAVKLLMTC